MLFKQMVSVDAIVRNSFFVIEIHQLTYKFNRHYCYLFKHFRVKPSLAADENAEQVGNF
jgi:hypothetical protein